MQNTNIYSCSQVQDSHGMVPDKLKGVGGHHHGALIGAPAAAVTTIIALHSQAADTVENCGKATPACSTYAIGAHH
jgi:hypothetical protein